jgi:acyl-CoA synthetase (AMP-forming)/AMP-acid ligase II
MAFEHEMGFRSLIDLLRRNPDNSKGITFIESSINEKFISYKDLYQKSLCTLGMLQKKGLKPGDEVVLQVRENERFLYIFWACLLGGIIPVPLSIGTKDEQCKKVIKVWEKLNKPTLVADSSVLKDIEEYSNSINSELYINEIKDNIIHAEDIIKCDNEGCIYESSPKDKAYIQFSSGSTGEPKGVILSHENILANIQSIVQVGNENDSCLSWLPLTHDMGMVGMHLTPMIYGVNQYIMPPSLFVKQPSLWLQKASDNKVSVLASPNFGYKYLLNFLKDEEKKDWDLSNVRIIFNGAEPISLELSRKFLKAMEKYGLKNNVMLNVYGLAEATLAVTFPPLGEVPFISYLDRNSLDVGSRVKKVDQSDQNSVVMVDVGYPIDGCEIRICDNDDEILGNEKVGHIQIKGRNVTEGYYNDRESTLNAFTEDGWLRTGDIGFISDGRLTITGRQKDIIFINGQNFYSHDLESVIEEIKTVKINEVAVCGVFDNETQKDELLVFVLFKKSVEDFISYNREIKRHIGEKTGIEAKHIIPVKSIPKTTSGKKQRYILYRQYENGDFNEIINKTTKLLDESKIIKQTSQDDALGSIEAKIIEIFADVSGNEMISKFDSFDTLKLDSLSMVIIMTKIKKEFGFSMNLNDVAGIRNINDLANMVLDAEKEEGA